MNEGLPEIKDAEKLIQENSANEQSQTEIESEAPSSQGQGRKTSETYSESDWQTQKSSAFDAVDRMLMDGADPRSICDQLGFQLPEDMAPYEIFRVLRHILSRMSKRERKSRYQVDDIVELIQEAKNIIVLTGAGISVSCGIPDFRSKNGLYATLAKDFPELPDPQSMFCLDFFRGDPRPFFRFAKEIYPGNYTPSPSHRFIAELEKRGKLLRNYTQNIDGLETQAGIDKVVQCHGHFYSAKCLRCGWQYSNTDIKEDIFAERIPRCCRMVELVDHEKTKAENIKLFNEFFPMKLPEPTQTETKPEPEQTDLKQIETKPESKQTETKPEPKQTEPKSEPKQTENKPEPENGTHKGEPTEEKPKEPPENSENKPVDVLKMPDDLVQDGNAEVKVPCNGVIKPDIVFFGESLPKTFHKMMTKDKDLCDLLIVMGSSLQVGPVNEIPDAISPNVPAILINRESLHSGSEFDGELLGNCDEIVKYLTHKLRWKEFDGNADLEEVAMEQLVKQAEQRLEQLKTQKPNQQQQEKLCDDKQNQQQQSDEQQKENETTAETENQGTETGRETESEPAKKRPKMEDIVPIEGAPGSTETGNADQPEVSSQPTLWQQTFGMVSRWKPKVKVPDGQFCRLESGFQTIFFGAELDLEEESESESESDEEIPEQTEQSSSTAIAEGENGSLEKELEPKSTDTPVLGPVVETLPVDETKVPVDESSAAVSDLLAEQRHT